MSALGRLWRRLSRPFRRPPHTPFDDVVDACSDSVAAAAAAVERRSADDLQRLVQLDAEGEVSAVSWRMRLPAANGGTETVTVPLAALYKPSEIRIRRVAFAFDAELVRLAPDAGPRRLAFRLPPGRSAAPERTKRVEIDLDGAGCGTVTVDGVELKRIAPPRPASDSAGG